MASEVYYFPFEDSEVLRQLAEGFKVAGVAERPPTPFLKLDRDNRLTGPKIESLLFGHTIKGTDYWDGTSWKQTRETSGNVSHTGTSFHTGNGAFENGLGWIEDDRLCERWIDKEVKVTICVMIFRDSARGQDNYYLVNDVGPHPFQVLK